MVSTAGHPARARRPGIPDAPILGPRPERLATVLPACLATGSEAGGDRAQDRPAAICAIARSGF